MIRKKWEKFKCKEKNKIKRNRKKRKSEEMHEKIRLNEIQNCKKKWRVKRNANAIENERTWT